MSDLEHDRNWWRSAIVDACEPQDCWMAWKFTEKLDEHKKRYPAFNAERVARMFIDAPPRVRAAYCSQPMTTFTKSIHRLAAWKSQAAKEDGMPGFDEQRAAQGRSMPPEVLASIPERRGQMMGGGPQMMSQAEGVMAARLAELSAEVRELRQMLAPPSAVILTGAEVAEHFKRLRDSGA